MIPCQSVAAISSLRPSIWCEVKKKHRHFIYHALLSVVGRDYKCPLPFSLLNLGGLFNFDAIGGFPKAVIGSDL